MTVSSGISNNDSFGSRLLFCLEWRLSDWTSPGIVDTPQPHFEARSNASTSRPPCVSTDRRPQPDTDVCDIGDPHGIRPLNRKFPLQPVGRNDRGPARNSTRRFVTTQSLDFMGSHDPGYAMLATGLAGLAQILEHAGRPVDTTAGRILARISPSRRRSSIARPDNSMCSHW